MQIDMTDECYLCDLFKPVYVLSCRGPTVQDVSESDRNELLLIFILHHLNS